MSMNEKQMGEDYRKQFSKQQIDWGLNKIWKCYYSAAPITRLHNHHHYYEPCSNAGYNKPRGRQMEDELNFFLVSK
jgi:hypothetical protein